MLFKLTYAAAGLDIHSSNRLRFVVPGSTDLEVIVRAPTDQERSTGNKSHDARVEIFLTKEPKKRSGPVFEAIAAGRRPREEEKALSAEDMVLRDGPTYGLDYYPNSFVAFIDGVYRSLAKTGAQLVKILRWRYAQEGEVSPMRAGGFSFSLDGGQRWHVLPGRYSTISATPQSSVLNVDRVDVNEVLSLLRSGVDEPLAHELLREAKEIQFDSCRSAVLIAVSAMEVGVKSVISDKIPEASWLIEASQSPPLVNLLSDFFPQLFPQGLPYSVERKDRFLSDISKAVFLRNTLAHRGAAAPTDAKAREILLLAEEVLWICDYLCGHGWALEYAKARARRQA